MLRRLWIASLLISSVALVGCTDDDTPVNTGVDASVVELKETMRKLWSDHVIWTREYIIAAAAGDASADAAAARLLKNQEDIGNAIVPYYGATAGTELTTLLKEHITIAVDLVAAAKAGNATMVADADTRWKANAAAIATFLAGANPNWDETEMRDMLYEHLALTTQEATAILESRWTDAATTFDQIFDQALEMADMLTDGIVKQFPEKF